MELEQLNAQLNNFYEQLNTLESQIQAEYQGDVAKFNELFSDNVDFDRQDIKRLVKVMDYQGEILNIKVKTIDAEKDYVSWLSNIFDANKDIIDREWNAIPVVSGLKIFMDNYKDVLGICQESSKLLSVSHEALLGKGNGRKQDYTHSLWRINDAYERMQSRFNDYVWLFKQAEDIISSYNLMDSEPGSGN